MSSGDRVRIHYRRLPDRERIFDQLLPALLDVRTGGDGMHEQCTLDLSLRLPPDLPPLAAETWATATIDSRSSL